MAGVALSQRCVLPSSLQARRQETSLVAKNRSKSRSSNAPSKAGGAGASLSRGGGGLARIAREPERTRHRLSVRALGSNAEEPAKGSSDIDPDESNTVELPLFPLPLVLFPGTILPLQVFEYRYRIMMQTLLQTDMRFGIVYTGKERGTASAVGCVAQVMRHERLPDDRFFLVCRGEERFRVEDVVRTRPYLVGRVSWLEDRPSGESPAADVDSDQPSELDTLANEVATIMSNVIRLTRKMKGPGAGKGGGKAEDEMAPLDLRKSAFPTPFSFWVGSTFEGAPTEQQALLELTDTAARLAREKETLTNTLNYLTAAAALKDAFPSSGDPSS